MGQLLVLVGHKWLFECLSSLQFMLWTNDSSYICLILIQQHGKITKCIHEGWPLGINPSQHHNRVVQWCRILCRPIRKFILEFPIGFWYIAKYKLCGQHNVMLLNVFCSAGNLHILTPLTPQTSAWWRLVVYLILDTCFCATKKLRTFTIRVFNDV